MACNTNRGSDQPHKSITQHSDTLTAILPEPNCHHFSSLSLAGNPGLSTSGRPSARDSNLVVPHCAFFDMRRQLVRYAAGVSVSPRAMAALDLVAPHCDIVERLQDVPPSAKVRGLYFKSVLNVLNSAGKLNAFNSICPPTSRSSIRFYSLKDYLVELAAAGAVVTSPRELHAGILEITRRNAAAFSSSVLGRVLIRVLAHDPVRVTEQGLAARRQSTSYGEWQLVRHGPRDISMVYHAEYMWIESAIAGAAAGTFESCKIQADIKTSLDNKYNGSTRIMW